MARKKSKRPLDEESAKELYTSKKYTAPKEKELETINEDSQEEKGTEFQLSPVSTCIQPHKAPATSFSVTGNGSRGTRISSRRGSTVDGSNLTAIKPALPCSSEVRKIDNIPFWLENKTKDRKRRAKVASLMKGRKKYKWKGLTIEEEQSMESMLLRCENSPLKRSSPRKLSPRKSILGEIKDTSNLLNESATDIKEDCESKHSAANKSLLEYDNCEFLDSYDSNISSTYPDDSVRSSVLEDKLEGTPSMASILRLDVDNALKGVKRQSSKEKAKRRSNSFIPVANKLLKEQNIPIEDTIDKVILDTCEIYKINSNETGPDRSLEHDKENISQYTPNASNIHTKTPNMKCESPYFAGFESDVGISPPKCDSSVLHLEDYNLQQVQEADRLFGGFLENTIKRSTEKRTSKKVQVVRRSSRLFREDRQLTGSVFVKI